MKMLSLGTQVPLGTQGLRHSVARHSSLGTQSPRHPGARHSVGPLPLIVHTNSKGSARTLLGP